MRNKVYCEGFNHFVEVTEQEQLEKGITHFEELHTIYGTLCPQHLSSEFFKCEKCFKAGHTRYDSLVLCEEHNKEFLPTVKKLYALFENNPNVTTYKL